MSQRILSEGLKEEAEEKEEMKSENGYSSIVESQRHCESVTVEIAREEEEEKLKKIKEK